MEFENAPVANGTGSTGAFELEDPDYLRRQLITYIGNKRTLLGPIGKAVETVKKRLNKTKALRQNKHYDRSF